MPQKTGHPNKKWLRGLAITLLALLVTIVLTPRLLTQIGQVLVFSQPLPSAEVAVVLNTGVEYYPRLLQAAALYRAGTVKKVVINGNRKSDTLRKMEADGLVHACAWDADHRRILALYGVPAENIISFSVEDAYDTISEAKFVGKALLAAGIRQVIVTTSQSHTRRAYHIWHQQWGHKFELGIIPASTDPYEPATWWRSGRQVRWVLAEYGAWLYFWWKT